MLVFPGVAIPRRMRNPYCRFAYSPSFQCVFLESLKF